jgi:hypothetical protein
MGVLDGKSPQERGMESGMAFRGLKLALLAGLLVWHTAVLRADGPPSYGPGFATTPASPLWQPPDPDYGSQTVPQSDRPPTPDQQPVNFCQYPSSQWPPTPARNEREPIACRQNPLLDQSRDESLQFRRLPPVPPNPSGTPQNQSPIEFNAGAAPPINGTWRDDGQYVIIDVNGQQLCLAKSALGQQQAGAAPPRQIGGGAVRGRLLQKGHPLVNCHVVIVPMHNEDGAAYYDDHCQPLTTLTNNDGIYFFEHVPAGSYKLTWLPNSSNQWIRRINMKPDVFVREGQEVTVKDLRSALQTIN